MRDIAASLTLALHLATGGDPELWGIVELSIVVSVASAFAACALSSLVFLRELGRSMPRESAGDPRRL